MLDIIEGGGRPIDPELRVRVTEAITAIRAAGGKVTVTAVRLCITERYGNAGDNGPLSYAVRIIRAEIEAQEVEPSLAVPKAVEALWEASKRQGWAEAVRLADERHAGERQRLGDELDEAETARQIAEGLLTTAHDEVRLLKAELETARGEVEAARREAAAAREAQAKAEGQAADERGRVDAALAAAAQAQEGATLERKAREAAETWAREAEAITRTAEGDRRAAESRAAEQADAAETRIGDLRAEQERRIEDLRQERDGQVAVWQTRLREAEAAGKDALKEARAEMAAERERIAAEARTLVDAADARAAMAERRLDDVLGRPGSEAPKASGRGRKAGG